MFGCFGKDNLVEEGEDAKDVFRRLIDAEDELPQAEAVFLEINAELAEIWPNITEKKDSLPEAEDWAEVKDKIDHLER